jgi:hypothetical protein
VYLIKVDAHGVSAVVVDVIELPISSVAEQDCFDRVAIDRSEDGGDRVGEEEAHAERWEGK